MHCVSTSTVYRQLSTVNRINMATDRYQYHDYFQVDELLTSEHLLVRNSVREWVKKEVSPIVEDAC